MTAARRNKQALLKPLAVVGVLAVLTTVLAAALALLQPTAPTSASHDQVAAWPQVDYVALDAVNEGGNSASTLQAGEPPWDACVAVPPSSTVNIDIVVDRVPTIPDTDDPSGAFGLEALVRYDTSQLTRAPLSTAGSFLGFNLGSSPISMAAIVSTVGTMRTDIIAIFDMELGDAMEDNIQGVGIRLQFTTASTPGLAQVELLDSSEGRQTMLIAGIGLEPQEASIANMFGGPNDGDPNDLQTVQVAIAPATCPTPQVDADGDGVPNATDNCPTVSNPGQENNDGDALGDACDPDDDNDGVLDGADNCVFVSNPGQENNDGDALGDACDPDDDNDGVLDGADNCVFVPNPGQENNDGDTLGDACDPDDDNDGILDADDNCPLEAPAGGLDADGDGCTDTIAGLRAIVEGLSLKPNIEGGLLGKLDEAQKALDRGNTRVAENKLRDFIDQVEAQRGKALTNSEANLLVTYASNPALLI